MLRLLTQPTARIGVPRAFTAMRQVRVLSGDRPEAKIRCTDASDDEITRTNFKFHTIDNRSTELQSIGRLVLSRSETIEEDIFHRHVDTGRDTHDIAFLQGDPLPGTREERIAEAVYDPVEALDETKDTTIRRTIANLLACSPSQSKGLFTKAELILFHESYRSIESLPQRDRTQLQSAFKNYIAVLLRFKLYPQIVDLLDPKPRDLLSIAELGALSEAKLHTSHSNELLLETCLLALKNEDFDVFLRLLKVALKAEKGQQFTKEQMLGILSEIGKHTGIIDSNEFVPVLMLVFGTYGPQVSWETLFETLKDPEICRCIWGSIKGQAIKQSYPQIVARCDEISLHLLQQKNLDDNVFIIERAKSSLLSLEEESLSLENEQDKTKAFDDIFPKQLSEYEIRFLIKSSLEWNYPNALKLLIAKYDSLNYPHSLRHQLLLLNAYRKTNSATKFLQQFEEIYKSEDSNPLNLSKTRIKAIANLMSFFKEYSTASVQIDTLKSLLENDIQLPISVLIPVIEKCTITRDIESFNNLEQLRNQYFKYPSLQYISLSMKFYALIKNKQKVDELFEKYKFHNSSLLYARYIKELTFFNDLNKVDDIYEEFTSKNLPVTTSMAISMVEYYLKIGEPLKYTQVIETLKKAYKTPVFYEGILELFYEKRQFAPSLKYFTEMVEAGVKPTFKSYIYFMDAFTLKEYSNRKAFKFTRLLANSMITKFGRNKVHLPFTVIQPAANSLIYYSTSDQAIQLIRRYEQVFGDRLSKLDEITILIQKALVAGLTNRFDAFQDLYEAVLVRLPYFNGKVGSSSVIFYSSLNRMLSIRLRRLQLLNEEYKMKEFVENFMLGNGYRIILNNLNMNLLSCGLIKYEDTFDMGLTLIETHLMPNRLRRNYFYDGKYTRPGINPLTLSNYSYCGVVLVIRKYIKNQLVEENVSANETIVKLSEKYPLIMKSLKNEGYLKLDDNGVLIEEGIEDRVKVYEKKNASGDMPFYPLHDYDESTGALLTEITVNRTAKEKSKN